MPLVRRGSFATKRPAGWHVVFLPAGLFTSRGSGAERRMIQLMRAGTGLLRLEL